MFQIKPGSAESLIRPSSGQSGSGREAELWRTASVETEKRTRACVLLVLKSATLNYAMLRTAVHSDHHWRVN